MWDSILGHEQNKEFLKRYLQAENRPHALFFCGAEGLGKRALAQQFAKTLLCLHADGMDGCESCRLLNFADGNISHPDFLLLAPEEDSRNIKIEQVKEIIRQSAFAPVLSKYKVCIVDGADKMTADAANSFLKLLEEPPQGWVIILIATAENALLPTILSRVVRLRFNPVDIALVKQLLQKQQVAEQEAEVLARVSEGSAGTALALSEQQFFDCRKQALALIEAFPLPSAFNYLGTFNMPDKDYSQAQLFIKALQVLMRDMLLLKIAASADLYNTDLSDELRELAAGWQPRQLRGALRKIDDAYKALTESAGIKLTLEAMVLQIDILRKE